MAMSPTTIAERAATRAYDKRMAKLISVADMVRIHAPEPSRGWTKETLSLDIDGCRIEGPTDRFNEMLERLGYRPVRITSNMLNKNSPRFAIDINTPAYCDPGREAYHSM